jgi:hypothetical protein
VGQGFAKLKQASLGHFGTRHGYRYCPITVEFPEADFSPASLNPSFVRVARSPLGNTSTNPDSGRITLHNATSRSLSIRLRLKIPHVVDFKQASGNFEQVTREAAGTP